MDGAVPAGDDNEPAKSKCVRCDAGNCAACLWRRRPTSCGCACDWLVADMTEHFPSLRENP